MTWLVTGGAGYIGGHVVRALVSHGLAVVVIDDLSSGRRERIPSFVPLEIGSVTDQALVARLLREHDVVGVVHLAGKKMVAESLADPLLYYRVNVGGCESLLRAMVDVGVARMVLSSSAAVYGRPEKELIGENAATEPTNPYGYTKLVCEHLLHDVAEAAGLRWVSLRYFNVAGSADPALGDTVPVNLIPMAFEAVTSGRRPQVFGADYPTPDGTCIRDFIHVVDLAEAHVAAVEALLAGTREATYNVGRGQGASVRQVLGVVEQVTGLAVVPEVVGRRPGDPVRVVADPARIELELGWRAERGLREMIESAWAGWQPRRAAGGS
jgi:UDP-glucose 4-epimerase